MAATYTIAIADALPGDHLQFAVVTVRDGAETWDAAEGSNWRVTVPGRSARSTPPVVEVQPPTPAAVEPKRKSLTIDPAPPAPAYARQDSASSGSSAAPSVLDEQPATPSTVVTTPPLSELGLAPPLKAKRPPGPSPVRPPRSERRTASFGSAASEMPNWQRGVRSLGPTPPPGAAPSRSRSVRSAFVLPPQPPSLADTLPKARTVAETMRAREGLVSASTPFPTDQPSTWPRRTGVDSLASSRAPSISRGQSSNAAFDPLTFYATLGRSSSSSAAASRPARAMSDYGGMRRKKGARAMSDIGGDRPNLDSRSDAGSVFSLPVGRTAMSRTASLAARQDYASNVHPVEDERPTMGAVAIVADTARVWDRREALRNASTSSPKFLRSRSHTVHGASLPAQFQHLIERDAVRYTPIAATPRKIGTDDVLVRVYACAVDLWDRARTRALVQRGDGFGCVGVRWAPG